MKIIDVYKKIIFFLEIKAKATNITAWTFVHGGIQSREIEGGETSGLKVTTTIGRRNKFLFNNWLTGH